MPSPPPTLTAWLDQLGQRPDREIARLSGCSQSQVRRERMERGIPAFVPPRRLPATTFHGSRIDPWLPMLGRLSDGEVARLAGCSGAAVSLYRRRRGIPAAREGGPAPTPPPLPGVTGTGTQVYAVDIEEGGELVRWNLCAANFPDACMKLLGVQGRVLRLRFIGERL